MSSSRLLQRSKSPRSVTDFFPHETLKKIPSLQTPNLGGSSSPRRSKQQMQTVVSHWKHHCLNARNESQRQRNARRRLRGVSFASPTFQTFDPERSVLSISQPSHKVSASDMIHPTPWYEQDYKELPWWEYPDLDEDDEITALCKQVVGPTKASDKVYVDRVEALVWTAAVKLQNIARYVLNKPQKKACSIKRAKSLKAVATKPRPSASSRGEPLARVQIPTMFVGLSREVQAEKKRYRKSSATAKKNKNKSQEEEATEEPTKKASTTPPAAAAPTETKPASKASTTKASTSTSSPSTSTPPPPPPRKVRTVVRIVPKKDTSADITPTPAAVFVREADSKTTPTTAARPRPRRAKSLGTVAGANLKSRVNIQKLKEEQRALKEKQQRMELRQQEQKQATAVLEEQQRRLARLKKRQIMS